LAGLTFLPSSPHRNKFVTLDRFLSAGCDSGDGVKVLVIACFEEAVLISINLNEPVSSAGDRRRDLRRHC
jgi:hypothetical protein